MAVRAARGRGAKISSGGDTLGWPVTHAGPLLAGQQFTCYHTSARGKNRHKNRTVSTAGGRSSEGGNARQAGCTGRTNSSAEVRGGRLHPGDHSARTRCCGAPLAWLTPFHDAGGQERGFPATAPLILHTKTIRFERKYEARRV